MKTELKTIYKGTEKLDAATEDCPITGEQIIEVARMATKKFKHGFNGHSYEDIVQEAVLIGIRSLDKYEPERGDIKAYLYRVMKNRIINFYRDESKKIIEGPTKRAEDLVEDFDFWALETKETANYLKENIEGALREDLLIFLDGAALPKKRRDKLLEAIYDLLEKRANKDGG